MADEAAQLTGDLGGPPRLAAWQQAQRAVLGGLCAGVLSVGG